MTPTRLPVRRRRRPCRATRASPLERVPGVLGGTQADRARRRSPRVAGRRIPPFASKIADVLDALVRPERVQELVERGVRLRGPPRFPESGDRGRGRRTGRRSARSTRGSLTICSRKAMVVVGEERGRGEDHRDPAGERDDRGELAPDRAGCGAARRSDTGQAGMVRRILGPRRGPRQARAPTRWRGIASAPSEEERGVHARAPPACAEVEVGAGRASGARRPRRALAAAHRRALRHVHAAQVEVHRDQPVAVVDEDARCRRRSGRPPSPPFRRRPRGRVHPRPPSSRPRRGGCAGCR